MTITLYTLPSCPVCVNEKAERIRYIAQDKEYCYDHRPEEEKIQAQKKKEVFQDLVKKSRKINNAKRRGIYQELKVKK